MHRESVERVLAENPQSLQVILDALLDALRQETASQKQPIAAEEQRRKKKSCARFRRSRT